MGRHISTPQYLPHELGLVYEMLLATISVKNGVSRFSSNMDLPFHLARLRGIF